MPDGFIHSAAGSNIDLEPFASIGLSSVGSHWVVAFDVLSGLRRPLEKIKHE